MLKKPARQTALLPALVLMTMWLTACANGQTPSTEACTKANPSGQFLRGLATEYRDGVYGQHTRETVKDWIAQNEPDQKEKP
jgi:hypothetical protein